MSASAYDLFRYELSAAMPEFAIDWVSRTREALRQSSADIALAHDRMLLFSVSEALMTHSRHLEASLSRELQTAMAAPERRSGGAQRLEAALPDNLGLVDEREAETAIEIARIVQLIDLTAEWELREMDAYMATLMQVPPGQPRNHPFRPARFAAAMAAGIASMGMDDDEKRLLLRVGGRVLARQLQTFYAHTCHELEVAGIEPQPFQAPVTPRRSPATVAPAEHPTTPAEALQTFVERAPEAAPTPAAADPARSAEQGASSVNLTFRSLDVDPPEPPAPAPAARPAASPRQVEAWIGALFKQLAADPFTCEAIKGLIASLEPVLQRMARYDRDLLASTQHPAWRFIDELAEQSQGYAQAEPHALDLLLEHAKPVVQELSRHTIPSAAQFASALATLQNFVENRHAGFQHTQAATLATLQTADHRLTLEPVVRKQLEDRLATCAVDDSIREFLLGDWVQVLTQALSTPDADDARTQGLLNIVDDLLLSLEPNLNTAQRHARRAKLPGLFDRLRQGMASIGMPDERQKAFLARLLHLQGHPGQGTRDLPGQPNPAAGRRAAASAAVEGRPDEGPATGGHRTARPSAETQVGSLPTVPMPYGGLEAAAARGQDPLQVDSSPAGWTRALAVGTWCKLSLHGQWTTAQLMWISDNREFFVFAPNVGSPLQSLTRKALERLRAEGLATHLEERRLVQRAVDSMLAPL